ncbi:MAG: hypothetical protein K2Y25_04990 [Pseudomonadaceae bacterium]|nr:hypothetical protein [Pseudomonadaceae bacterium]
MSSSEAVNLWHWLNMLASLPLWVVWLLGVALCVQLWPRHNRACLCALLALLIQLSWTGLRWLLTTTLPEVFNRLGLGGDSMQLFMLLGVVAQCLNAVCWAMLLWALRLALLHPQTVPE